MKRKTIKTVLRKKTNEWLSSIKDEDLQKYLKDKIIITGGAIASMFLGEKVNDFDIYLRNREAALKLAWYYVKQFKENLPKALPPETPIYVEEERVSNEEGAEKVPNGRIKIVVKSAGIASENGSDENYRYFEQDQDPDAVAANTYVGEIMQDPGDIQDTYEELERHALNPDGEGSKSDYRPVFLSTNAITLSGKIQIVIRFWGEPEEIHKNYDYIHCTNYWTSWKNELETTTKSLEALLAKELVYVGSKYPLCSIFRMRKFINRGWTINTGQILKMVMQLNELDLTNLDVLEDQLTGVDVAYFNEVIDKLKSKDPQKVTTSYLIEILDRMF
jgi:hypothetical protein